MQILITYYFDFVEYFFFKKQPFHSHRTFAPQKFSILSSYRPTAMVSKRKKVEYDRPPLPLVTQLELPDVAPRSFCPPEKIRRYCDERKIEVLQDPRCNPEHCKWSLHKEKLLRLENHVRQHGYTLIDYSETFNENIMREYLSENCRICMEKIPINLYHCFLCHSHLPASFRELHNSDHSINRSTYIFFNDAVKDNLEPITDTLYKPCRCPCKCTE